MFSDHYEYKTEPFQHQKEHFEKHRDSEYWGLFWQQGTAKTKPIIDTASHLYETSKIDVLVIITLKGVHTNWIKREIPKHMPDRVPRLTHTWVSKKTSVQRKGEEKHSEVPKYLQRERDRFLKSQGRLKILAINIEAFSHGKLMKDNEAIKYLAQVIKKHKGRCMGVVDESSTIKDPKSSRTDRVIRFGPHFTYRRVLTGTPITQSPFDIYTQTEFLKPGLLGFRNYSAFTRHHGCYRTVHFGHGATRRSFQQLDSYAYLDELRDKLKVFSDEMTKADCLDLPPKLFEIRDVELSLEQIRAYDQMQELYLHEMQTAEEGVKILSATNALHRLRRLHDITLGFARDDPDTKTERVTHRFPHNRLRVLDEIIAEEAGKMLIFADAVPAIEELVEHLAKEYGKESVVAYYGAIGDADRDIAIDSFQDLDSKVRFLVGGSMSSIVYGQTLHAANTVVFYSNAYSLERRLQAEDRAHRAGLTHPVLYIDICATGTVDEKVRESLMAKIDIASQVVSLMDDYMLQRPDQRLAG